MKGAGRMLKELIEKNRSYRRFYEEKPIDRNTLEEFINIARITPSGANLQPTRYIISNTKEENALIFSCLRWAAYYKDWDGPEEGERPSAYIIMLLPEKAEAMWDEGIKGQTILLAAAEKGIGGCFIANIDKKMFTEKISIPNGYKVDLVIALGYPKENVILHDVSAEDDIKYYRDKDGNQHVPKIRLEDLIIR